MPNKGLNAETLSMRGDVEMASLGVLTPHDAVDDPVAASADPPTFAQSQLHTIIRRQIARPRDGSGVKDSRRPSRFANFPIEIGFAGWGRVQWEILEPAELAAAGERLQHADNRVLGHWIGSAVVGNALLGSMFYAFPAVAAVAGIYSPLSLFVAACIIFVFRPILIELTSAIPVSGSIYAFFLHSTQRYIALAAATVTLLDNVATSMVSAATSAAYLAGEVTLPFSSVWLTVILLVLFSLIAIAGLKESASLAFVILAVHLATMLALIIASIVSWGRHGNEILHDNWTVTKAPDAAGTLKSIFYGVCLSFLGMTGFECSPQYISSLKKGRYPLVLRNLLWPALFLNAVLMLCVFAIFPHVQILQAPNILSRLGEVVVGRGMRIWITVDACACLCAGVLTGIISNVALFERLAKDRVLPELITRQVPRTGAQWISILASLVLCCVLFLASGGQLRVVSLMFSAAFLAVVGLFALSLLMIDFHRGRLPRSRRSSIWVSILALLLILAVFGGNIALAPATIGYFAAYFVVLFGMLCLFANPVAALQWLYWMLDQVPFLHQRETFATRWGQSIVKKIKRLRQNPVACLVKTDRIDSLLEMLLYVQDNELASCVKLVHFFGSSIEDIPSELEANMHIIDEAFPHITVDLLFVQAPLTPAALEALGEKIGVPRNMMFMRTFSDSFPYDLDQLGTRIIGL